jgi:hypothetical protein
LVSIISANIVIGLILSGDNPFKSHMVSIGWNPLSINVQYYSVINGEAVAIQGFSIYPNGPFIIFLISTVVNILLFVLMKSGDKDLIKKMG